MVNQEELADLLFCSMRYAYGRITYIVDDVVRITRAHYHEISARQQDSLLDDLNRELFRAAEACKFLGGEYQHRLWVSLRDFMEEHKRVG